jgi:hypothetical protein
MRTLILFSVLTVAASVCNAQWVQSNGPMCFEVSCFVTKDANLFAGTWSGVFRSTDNGTSWNSAGLTDTSVSSLAVSPNGTGGTNLFAGTYSGVSLSTNDGTSWTPVNAGLPEWGVGELAVIGTNVFASTPRGGVFLSTNNGQYWAAANSGLTDSQSVNVLLAVGTTLFASTQGGTYRTTNNGSTWTHADVGLPVNVPALAVLGETLFAGAYWDGVFSSTNNGTNWTPVNTGLAARRVFALAVFDTTLFAGTEDSGVYRTTNNGTNWTQANTGLTVPFVRTFGVTGSGLFTGTWGGGLFRTTNNGTDWAVLSHGVPEYPVGAIVVSGTNLFAGVGSGGRGAWGVVFRSTDNGESWTPQMGSGEVSALCSKGMTLFAGTNLGVSRSTNNGETWTAENTGLPEYPLVTSLAVSDTSLFAGTEDSGVYRTTNNGTNWTPVISGLAYDSLQNHYPSVVALAVSSTSLLAGLREGYGVYLSTNNGTSWTAAGLTNTFVNALAVSPNGAGDTNLFVGTWGDGVFRSTDNGTSWTAVRSGMADSNVFSFAVSGMNLFAGTSNGVYYSSNGGTTWASVNTGLMYHVGGLAVHGTNLFAGTGEYGSMPPGEGTGIWKRPLSEMITDVENVQEFPPQYVLQQNYPNPFNPTTSIKFDVPSSKVVTLKVFDILGREVATLLNEEKSAGTHTVTWDASSVSSGVYFYRIKAGDFVQTKRMMVVH